MLFKVYWGSENKSKNQACRVEYGKVRSSKKRNSLEL